MVTTSCAMFGTSFHTSSELYIPDLISLIKNNRMISVRFQGKPFNIMVIQVYAPTTNAEEAEQFFEDQQDLLEPTHTHTHTHTHTQTKTRNTDVLDWNAKVGSQKIPGVKSKFSFGVQNEARQRLTEFCQENTLLIANTLFQQHERILHMDITRWSILKSGFPGGTAGKESACNAGDLGSIPVSRRSPEKGMATHPSVLDWRIPRTEGPGGL